MEERKESDRRNGEWQVRSEQPKLERTTAKEKKWIWRCWWQMKIEGKMRGQKHYWRKGVKRQTNTEWVRNE